MLHVDRFCFLYSLVMLWLLSRVQAANPITKAYEIFPNYNSNLAGGLDLIQSGFPNDISAAALDADGKSACDGDDTCIAYGYNTVTGAWFTFKTGNAYTSFAGATGLTIAWRFVDAILFVGTG